MDKDIPYTAYAAYLKKIYGKKAYRVGVDGGFTCPNRIGAGKTGCSYCDETGSVAVYQRTSESGLTQRNPDRFHPTCIPPHELRRSAPLAQRKSAVKRQIEDACEFLKRRYAADLFLLYFQAFSGTFDRVSVLEELYSYALGLRDFRELIVSTRPDCIDRDTVKLLARYREELHDVWTELGLQTGVDRTLDLIHRGHQVKEFRSAYDLLRRSGIKVSVHLMLGLPGEGYREIDETAALIREIHPDALKIHNLHIPMRTELLDTYLGGEVTSPSADRHISYTIHFLEQIQEDIIIQRVTADTPGHRLAAPKEFPKKGTFISRLRREMGLRKTSQGRCFEEFYHEKD